MERWGGGDMGRWGGGEVEGGRSGEAETGEAESGRWEERAGVEKINTKWGEVGGESKMGGRESGDESGSEWKGVRGWQGMGERMEEKFEKGGGRVTQLEVRT